MRHEPTQEDTGELPEQAPAPTRAARLRRLVLLAIGISVFATLVITGAFDDPEAIVQAVRDAGPWGMLAYLAAFTFLQPFGPSGHVFVLPAAVVWGPWMGFMMAMLGALGAASVGFAFGRYVAFSWVQARIPAKLRRYEQWITERGLLGMVLFRTFTFTSPPGQLLVGTLRIGYPTMLLGSAIGFVPGIAIDMTVGGAVFAVLVGG